MNTKFRNLQIGLSLLISIAFTWGCDNNLPPMNQSQELPPNFSRRSSLDSFSPKTGGVDS